MADGSKVVQFEKKKTNKTRQGGLRNKTRSLPRKMWSTDGDEWDLIRLFEEWPACRHRPIENSGPLYLAIISGPSKSVGSPNLKWMSIELAK